MASSPILPAKEGTIIERAGGETAQTHGDVWSLVRDAAARTPDAVAVFSEGHYISYEALVRRVEAMAGHLALRGIDSARRALARSSDSSSPLVDSAPRSNPEGGP
jgi:non-ribosomal peptide synthetase component E (peptide arylation enzyme)